MTLQGTLQHSVQQVLLEMIVSIKKNYEVNNRVTLCLWETLGCARVRACVCVCVCVCVS
jgi:hypothetical protein